MQARMVVRPAVPSDAAVIARVHVDAWRTSYRGLVPNDVLAGLSYDHREQMWKDSLNRPLAERRVMFVAEDPDGGVVGFTAGGPESSGDPIFASELYAIYILEAWQRKGVGRRLFHAVVDGLAGAGFSSMLLWVFADNGGARRFYESLGGRLVKKKPIEIGWVTLSEVAYGWHDLSALVETQYL